MDRVALGRMQNPVRGILHGSAAVLSVAGAVLLVELSRNRSLRVALFIYGFSLVGLYLTSALYHSVPWGTTWRARFQRLDHTMIHILVAGTCTPLLIAVLDGRWLRFGLAMMWGLAAVGAIREFFPKLRKLWSLALQLLIGALALGPLGMALLRMDRVPLILTVGGGVIYLVGLIAFVTGRPRLSPRIFSHHEMWHVVVIVASAAHFLAVWLVVGGPLPTI